MRNRSARQFSGGADVGEAVARVERNADRLGQFETENRVGTAVALRRRASKARAGTERIVSILKRRLWLLNFVLIASIAAAGWRLRNEAAEFHARERVALRRKVAVA